jgi:hypothetical protein
MMPAADVARYIVDDERPATRRFRVEGSRVGNSMLLNADNAKKEAVNYGGKVVEVTTLDAVFREMAVGLPRCERKSCRAEKDEPCHDKKGFVSRPHKNRFGDDEPVRELHKATKHVCPVDRCKAPVGEACKGKNGRNCAPHKERIALLGGNP